MRIKKKDVCEHCVDVIRYSYTCSDKYNPTPYKNFPGGIFENILQFKNTYLPITCAHSV